ncbi:hypothetical protein SAMN05216474_0179 [Lishizhenia tianjinensis]|uniref:Uncharacterized protein n=1 Tax=Lishizhenia tianjinensis TaxID=477690 RepID=A0A1I6XHH5_9FLAO|nr:hypothetical protein [Lishizhenia tianjinensis]SFT37324.1 hypothetical protein SAMN05216474_0179 [Lishizhenia tianjinensis]
MSAAKLVGLTTILYLIMALQSLLGLGVFLPILPLKEVLVALMAIALGVMNWRKDKKPYAYLLFYGLIGLLFSNFTLEILLSAEERIQFNKEVSDFIGLAQLILMSILLFYLSLERIAEKIRFNLFPFLTLIAIVLINFFGEKSWEALAILPLSLAFYIQYHKADEDQINADKYHAIKMWFTGFAVLGAIDILAIWINK